MFYWSKPSASEINAFIETARSRDFSYKAMGSTLTEATSADYSVDHNRVHIGNGEEGWEKAKQAIRDWKMFEMPWVDLCWPDTPIEESQTVAILIRHFGFYSLNAAKIVYTIDKWDRFGFAYGTLADHGESGEERFMVTMDRETGEVWYDLYAFSNPITCSPSSAIRSHECSRNASRPTRKLRCFAQCKQSAKLTSK